MIKNILEKIKLNKWKIIFSFVLMVSFVSLILLLMSGFVYDFLIKTRLNFKNINFNWNLIKQFLMTAYQTKYVFLSCVLISLSLWIYFVFKLIKTKLKEPTLKDTKQEQFGSAKWLDKKTINQLFPLVKNIKHNYHGFVVNSFTAKNNTWFNIKSNLHNLVLASTGGGKTQGIVLPTIYVNALGQIKPSFVITDPKGEILNQLANFLKANGYLILTINFREMDKSMAWNPLNLIYQQFKEMVLSDDTYQKAQLKANLHHDLQDLVKTIFIQNQAQDKFWEESGAIIGEAILLGILEEVETKLKDIDNKQEREEKLNEILPLQKFNLASLAVITSFNKDMILWFNQKDDNSLSKVIASQLLLGESKTLTSILMTMSSSLAIFKSDLVRSVICKNELNFNDLVDKPCALFMVIPDENKNYYFLVSLLIQQIYKFLVKKANNSSGNTLARPVYFLCDEFGNIPTIVGLDNMITIARSRNIFFQLIIQNIKQLEIRYGKEQSDVIFTNCNLHTFLQTMDLNTAEHYSKYIGNTTKLLVSTSGKGKSYSQSESLKEHRLIQASELMKLNEGEAIVLLAKQNPAKNKLVPWWQINKSLKVKPFIETKRKVEILAFDTNYFYDIRKSIKVEDNNKESDYLLDKYFNKPIRDINNEAINKFDKFKDANVDDYVENNNDTDEIDSMEETNIKELIDDYKTKLKNLNNKNDIESEELKKAYQRQIDYLEEQLDEE